MAYSAEISRSNPTCFVCLLDQSASMLDAIGGGMGESSLRKADVLADVANRILYELIMRCTKPEEVRNYYHVSIIGYGNGVGSAFGGTLAGRDVVLVSELADSPVRVETRTKRVSDGAGGLVEQQVKFPVWIDPRGENATPMCEAFTKVNGIIEEWISDARHKTCFPPTVLHVTDGESTDGDPTELARRTQSMSVSDGSVLLFNCHLSSERVPTIEYPASSAGLPNQYAKMLFDVSSVLPDKFAAVAKEFKLPVQTESRGFVFNADPASLVQFFDIGTRLAHLR